MQGPETGGSRCPGGWAGPQNTDWRTRSWCSQAEEEEKHTVLEENKGNTEIQGGGEKTRATQIQGGGEKLCLPNARDSTAFAEPRGEGVSWALQENRGGSELGVERDQRRLEKQVGGPRSSLA